MSVRCVWCETELAPEDAKPILYARLPDRPDTENMQCKDEAACDRRQARLDDEQRAMTEAAGKGLFW
jgi:hypothetical protein